MTSLLATNNCQLIGRLVAIDVRAGYQSVSDVEAMGRMIAEHTARVPQPTRIVTAADWRGCRIFTPEIAVRVHDVLSTINLRLERAAILQNAGFSTSVMQGQRLTREAQHPDRRVFTDAAAMVDWLGEVLTPSETTWLRVWLVNGH